MTELRVGIEGIIGAGKTTFINNMRNHVRENYKDIHLGIINEVINHELLESFYQNPKEMCSMLQVHIMNNSLNNDKMVDFSISNNILIDDIDNYSNITVKNDYIAKYEYQIYIKDRTTIGNMVFAIVNFLKGNMTEVTFKSFYKLIKPYLLTQGLSYKMEKILYLDNPVDDCIRNINIRNRKGEDAIERSYLYDLDMIYFIMIINLIYKRKNIIIKTWNQYCHMNNMDSLLLQILNEKCSNSVTKIKKKFIDKIKQNSLKLCVIDDSGNRNIIKSKVSNKTYKYTIVYEGNSALESVYEQMISNRIFDEVDKNTIVCIPYPNDLLLNDDNETFDSYIERVFISKKYNIDTLSKQLPYYLRRIIMKHLSLNHSIILYS